MRVAAGAVARDDRVGERDTRVLGGARGALARFAPRHAHRRRRRLPVELERELLELAQEARLALADQRDERFARRAIEREAERAGLRASPSAAAPTP